MRTGDDFPAVVSGRVTARAEKLMDEYGFTVRDAVEWYLIYKVDPKRRIELDKTLLKDEIKNLKLDLISLEMQLQSLEEESQ